ncbi:MAG: hypothetical protein FE834_10515 [Gammaproteobacteria bacterium]|nr:hypothetical protein [Gammaproteobacteria bacterium]
MNILIPISHFSDEPRSEIWQINTVSKEKKLLTTLPKSTRPTLNSGITGMSWLNEKQLVACDFNRIFIINSIDWSIAKQNILLDNELNDLHSIYVSDNKIYITNTGRDTLDIYNSNLVLIERYSALSDQELTDRKNYNYALSENDSFYTPKGSPLPFYQRKVVDKYHFNHLTIIKQLNGLLVATCFAKKCLLNGRTLEVISNTLPHEPHDGVIYKDYLWITTINGNLYKAKIELPFKFELVVELFKKAPCQGWCRGLMIDKDYAYIAITQINKQYSKTRWLTQSIDETCAGVYKFNLKTNAVEDFYDLSHQDKTKIFIIVKGNYSRSQ